MNVRLAEIVKYAHNPISEYDLLVERLIKQGKEIIKLNQGDPAIFFKTPKHIIEAYKRALDEGHTNYSSIEGVSELRNKIKERYHNLYNLDFDEERVIITNGVSEAIMFLNNAYINKNDNVLILSPFYPIYIPFAKMRGARIIFDKYEEINDEWTINTKRIEKIAKNKKIKYMVLINPNNPTGAVLSEDKLDEIARIAKKNNILLISDEIYDEIVYNGAKFHSISEFVDDQPYIIFNGFSKDYDATGFRLGYAIFPNKDSLSNKLLDAFIKLASLRISSNTPAQYAMAYALDDEKEHKNEIYKMRKEIEKRTNFLTDGINGIRGMHAVRPRGAFYIFASIDKKIFKVKDDKDFVYKLLIKKSLYLSPGSGFGMKDYVRFVSLAPQEILEKAINLLNEFEKGA